MKAKWRDKVFEVNRVGSEDGYLYDISQVEFIDEKVLDDTFDEVYWENMKHQYAGMAMQGFLAGRMEDTYLRVAEFSVKQAAALVEKLKGE